jgi:hypothetical protein
MCGAETGKTYTFERTFDGLEFSRALSFEGNVVTMKFDEYRLLTSPPSDAPATLILVGIALCKSCVPDSQGEAETIVRRVAPSYRLVEGAGIFEDGIHSEMYDWDWSRDVKIFENFGAPIGTFSAKRDES